MNHPTPLSNAPIGQRMKIHRLRSTAGVAHRLRELGLRENAIVRCVLRSNERMICEIDNDRIGLNKHIAGDIDTLTIE
jgi:Fe2+ transport system protein FeoA